MTRIKSMLATTLLSAAAMAVLGLGTMLAVAGLVLGLVVALAARLAVGAAGEPAKQADCETAAPGDPVPMM